jgi:hypothetical protein
MSVRRVPGQSASTNLLNSRGCATRLRCRGGEKSLVRTIVSGDIDDLWPISVEVLGQSGTNVRGHAFALTGLFRHNMQFKIALGKNQWELVFKIYTDLLFNS